MRYHKIADETIRRMPIYLRGLMALSQEGHQHISSNKLADHLGIAHWQIRKDFSYFGEFGTPGVGYQPEVLLEQIRKILRLNCNHKVVIIGAGNLGSAIMAYPGFHHYGFQIVVAFDSDPKKIGKTICGIPVKDAAAVHTIKRRKIQMGIIAVPPAAAQQSADALVKADIRGILNFSSSYINVPKRVKLIDIDIAMDLARLPYYVSA